MQLDDALREQLITQDLCQGRLVRYAREGHTEPDLFIIATQTCDLLQARFATEPYAELLPVTLHPTEPLPKSAAKSARYTSLSLASPIPEQGHVHIAQRHVISVDRQHFLSHLELLDERLTAHAVGLFVRWLGSRYTRHAFPDLLADCLARVDGEKRIAKALLQLPRCSGFYLNYEAPAPHTVETMVFRPLLLLTVENGEDHDARNALHTTALGAMDTIAAVFREAGLQIALPEPNDEAVQFEDEARVATFRTYTEMSFDNLTARDRTETHAMPPQP